MIVLNPTIKFTFVTKHHPRYDIETRKKDLVDLVGLFDPQTGSSIANYP